MPVMGLQLIRNFLSGPATRPYPTNKRTPFPQWRGDVKHNPQRCVYCGICANICPANAIKMEEDYENLVINRVFDSYACIYCGRCVELCPNWALTMVTQHPGASLAKSKDVASSR